MRVDYTGRTSCGCPYINQPDPAKHWKECHYRLNSEAKPAAQAEATVTDLNEMSPGARSAAMRGGMDGWGVIGGQPGHIRYMEQMEKKSRKHCHCGCRTRKTHRGMANGECLVSGCEMKVRRWVKQGEPHNG